MHAGRGSRAISESLTLSAAKLTSANQGTPTESRTVGRGLSFPSRS